MSNIIEYSTKATAVRGLGRMGVEKHDAPKFITENRAGKFCVDQDAVEAEVKIAHLSQRDKDLRFDYGVHECPSCGINLDNGVLDYDGLVDQHGEKEAYKLQKKEFSCMACGHDFGKDIDPPKGAKRKAATANPLKGERAKSTVEGPVAIVWALADNNPGAKRKEIVAMAMEAGVTKNTANTQFQYWRKARGLVKARG